MKWKAKQFFSILIAVVLLCTSTLLSFPGTLAATDIPEHSEEFLDDNNRKEDEASSISTTEKTEGKEQQQTGDTQKAKETEPTSGLADDTDGPDDGKQEETGKDNKKTDVANPPGDPVPKTDKKEETTSEKSDKKESGDKPAVKEDGKQDKPETTKKEQAESGSETREQTEKQKIDIMNMKEGETITFRAMAGSSTKRVSVTRGAHYEYSDYGLGSFETYKYHVSFGNISATAYCVEPSKHSPDSGTYTITKLSDGKNLAKVCYYGTKAAGEDSFFSEKHAGYSEGKRFVLVHLAASYANNGSDAFSGANSTARGLAMELYNWCISQPDIPDVDMEFSDDDVTAYVENGVQRTKEIRFKADKMQSITFHLPKGVKLHNISTGKVSQAGADVEISGGTSFYLSAPLTQAADVNATFSSTMKGSVVKDFSAYKISIGNGQQDLALVFGDGVDDEKYIDFKVSWISLGELTIIKEGEELTSVDKSADGAVFHYKKEKQKNAVYEVHADETIKDSNDTVIFKKGDLVAGNLKTGSDGSVTLKNLYAGTYSITEKTAPAGFYNNKEKKTVEVIYSSDSSYKKTFVNDRQKAEISVVKQDKETRVPLAGAVLGLYTDNDIKDESGKILLKKDSLIEKITSDQKGIASFKADIPLGYSYYIKELKAPENYYRNQKDTFQFRFTYTNGSQERQTFSYTLYNERVKAKIRIIKKDSETGENPQGDAVLQGAVYGLFARQNITHPDKKTGIMYKSGERVALLTTDKSGHAEVKDLYLGNYYIKELSPSTGYLIDKKEYDITASYEGDLKAVVEKEAASDETVIKQPFQLIKAGKNDKTDADLLEGAGFCAYLISKLKKDSKGCYMYENADPVILTKDGKTELLTDKTGYAVSIPIPYGTYLVVEKTTPHNFKPVDPFIVRITENHPDTPQVWRALQDEEFRAKLKIIKQDDETKRAVLLPDTEFKIFDVDHQSYVSQTTTYPKTVRHTSFFTNEEGYLILPENLRPGKYRIEEVQAPEGYSLNNDYPEILIDSDTMHQIDSISGDVIIDAVYENHPVKGELVITKTGEILSEYDGKDFHYKEGTLEGAEFEVYAAEDIFTPDHHVDIEGNRLVAVEKDSLVSTVVTDEDGKAIADNLPLGKYYVKEKKVPEGYCLNPEQMTELFEYEGQNKPVITKELSYYNERQKAEITVVKKDTRSDQRVAGAEFGIYSKEDIMSGDIIIVPADTLLQTFESDKEGTARCTLDLPLVKYYIRELEAPPGYIISDTVIDIDASYQGPLKEQIALTAEMKNDRTVVEISKSDLTTGVEIAGAKLMVLDEKGHVVDSWISEKDTPHAIYGLVAGNKYLLREELAPYGYLKASEISFTVPETGEVQKVEMKDEVPTGMLIISKKGEFLTKVTLIKHVKGLLERLFEYVSGSLQNVSFELYAAEDIKAADGVSKDYYKKDELVAELTTDQSGYASVKDLPLGKYYLKEKTTVHGHILDFDPCTVDLSYRNQNTPIVVYDKDWKNNRQKVAVTISKIESESGKGLGGGIFGMFAKKPIYSSDGRLLLEADEIIELKTTDKSGHITFSADLPIDAEYYIKELYAPPGYHITKRTQSFRTDYQGEKVKEQKLHFVFKDRPTVVEISKTDLVRGTELPGAHLIVTDESGKTVNSWVSTVKPHVIKGLIVGKKYTLTETKPADGYVTAESIEFTIKEDYKVQTVEMKDDVTKAEISKQDLAGKELPGAKLSVIDSSGKIIEQWVSGNVPHYISMLPVGHYTLREETAPKGYLRAEEVHFEIKDTARIQHVKMTDKPDHPSEKSKIPKTGDDHDIYLWFTILLAGTAGILIIAALKYRHIDRSR